MSKKQLRWHAVEAALRGLSPQPGVQLDRTFAVGDGLVADVHVCLRRDLKFKQRERFIEEACAVLERDPAKAEHCGEYKKQRSRFGCSLQCENLPLAAYRWKGLSGRIYWRFICANHAKRIEREGGLVVRMGARRMRTYRLRATAEREKRYRQERAVEVLLGWFKDLGSPSPPTDELALRRRRLLLSSWET